MTIYDLYHFLRLEIDSGGVAAYERYFDNEFSRIDALKAGDETGPQHTVTLRIVPALPSDLPADAIVRRVRFKKLFTFEFAVVGAGTEHATVWFVDHKVSRLYVTAVGVFIQGQVLEPVMYLSVLRAGGLLMHAGGVARDGKAHLFPAHGGTGKTTMTIGMLAKGYSFLGDDLILVDPTTSTAYAYPRPLHVFTYNIRNLQGADIPWRISAAIYGKNVLRFVLERVLRTEFLISTRVHADEVLDDLQLAEPSTLRHVMFLVKEGEHRHLDLGDAEQLEEAAVAVIDSADLNLSLFDVLQDDAARADIRAEELAIARSLLSGAEAFTFMNTRRLDLDEADRHVEDPTSL